MRDTKNLTLQNSKLLQILASFSEAEFKEFGQFMRSPYFNNSERLVKLYEFLKAIYPHFEKRPLGRDELFRVMYPGQKFDDSKLRNRLALMTRRVEDYLIDLEFRQRPFEKKVCLVSQLAHRKLDEWFEVHLEQLFSYIERADLKHEEYNLRKFILEKIKGEHLESTTLAGKRKPVHESLMAETENLTVFSLIVLLRSYLKLISAERIGNLPSPQKPWEKFFEVIETQHEYFKRFPGIEILYRLVRFKQKPDEAGYRKLKTLLDENPKVLRLEDYSIAYIELYNYCKNKQEEGSSEHAREAFELMKLMRSGSLFYENDGFLHPNNYVNFALAALRIGELSWAESFINEFKNKVREEFREDAFNYCHAALDYIRSEREPALSKNYLESALAHVSRVKKADLHYYYRIKELEILIFYEQENLNAVLRAIDSFTKILCKPGFPEDVRLGYTNFANYLKKLVNIQDHKDSFGLEQLKKELEADTSTYRKKWLLGKMEEALKSNRYKKT